MIQLTLQGVVSPDTNGAYHSWLEDIVISKVCKVPPHELWSLWNFCVQSGSFSGLPSKEINKLRGEIKKYVAMGRGS